MKFPGNQKSEREVTPRGRTAEEKINNLLFRIVINLDCGLKLLERGELGEEERAQVMERIEAARREALEIGEEIKSAGGFMSEGRGGRGGKRGEKASILVVDDEPMIGRLVQRMLGDRFEVVAVESFRAAREAVQAGGFEYLFCDVHIPREPMRPFLKWLKSSAPALYGKTILITGGSFSGEDEALIRGSGRPVMYKPFQLRDMEEAIREVGEGE